MRALVADDDRMTTVILSAALQRQGFEVTVVHDGITAWERITGDAPPSLAIIDWMMPGLDGPELCSRVRQEASRAHLYLILLTSRADRGDLIAGLDAGADDYLTKPFDADELRARVHVGSRVLALQQRLAERVADLQQMMANVKHLRGLLPICSYCKRIRSDSNYWEQVESYISDHTEAQFSHGICPCCYEKVMAELGLPAESMDTKSGDLINVEITSHSLTFGDRPAALVTAADVTDRTRAETALAERTAMSALTADVGVALNRPCDLPVCLQHCADAIVARLDGATAGIWKLNASGDTLALVASAGRASGLHAKHRRVPLGQFTIGRIAQDRRARCTNDVSAHPELWDEDWAQQPGISAFAGCPLLVDSRVVGVMAVFANHPLSSTVTNAVAAVADLIALGITRDQSEGARRLLAAIVESSDDAIFGTAPDGTVMSWNSGAQKLFGYAAEEIVGRSMSLLCPPDGAGELADLLLKLRQGVHVAHHETVRQRRDGSQVPVSISLSPIRDSAARIAGISAMMRDITERQRAERTLRESEDRFRLIAETVTQVFWIADVETRTMIFVSPAYERIWGRSCESLRTDPRSFLEAVHDEDRAHVIDVLAVQQSGEPFEHEYRIVRPDREVRWIWDRGFPVRPRAAASSNMSVWPRISPSGGTPKTGSGCSRAPWNRRTTWCAWPTSAITSPL